MYQKYIDEALSTKGKRMRGGMDKREANINELMDLSEDLRKLALDMQKQLLKPSGPDAKRLEGMRTALHYLQQRIAVGIGDLNR